jgi:hypothetical protein
VQKPARWCGAGGYKNIHVQSLARRAYPSSSSQTQAKLKPSSSRVQAKRPADWRKNERASDQRLILSQVFSCASAGSKMVGK